jgi:hypothetical protein
MIQWECPGEHEFTIYVLREDSEDSEWKDLKKVRLSVTQVLAGVFKLH